MKNAIFLNVILFLCSIFCTASAYEVTDAEQLTYNWFDKVGNQNGDFDFLPHFRKIFRDLEVKTLLQLGVGYSTKYFLDSCDKVISVEFITHGYGPEGMKRSLHLFRNYSNWEPIAYLSGFIGDTNWAPKKFVGSDAVYKACTHQCITHQNYALIDKFYLIELKLFFNQMTRLNKIDVAFVDSDMYLRGDFIQLLFDKVPVIVAHDTACRSEGVADDVFGYSRLVTPENYEEIYLPSKKGSTIWIIKKEEYKTFTERMKKYSEALQIVH